MIGNRSMYLKIGLAVAALGVTYFLAAVIIPKVIVTMTRAAPATIISVADSRVLGEKILAKADGKDRCIVNVFVLDKDSKGIAGKNVVLEGIPDIAAIVPTTDNEGKTSFAITSKDEGQFRLTAQVDGTPLPREIKVTFRN